MTDIVEVSSEGTVEVTEGTATSVDVVESSIYAESDFVNSVDITVNNTEILDVYASGPLGDINPNNPFLFLTAPYAPNGFNGVPMGFTGLALGWSEALYVNHKLTEVWRSTVDDISTASMYTTTGGSGVITVVDFNTEYYHWIRFVSYANVIGPWHDTNGLMVLSNGSPANMLSILEGEIRESKLHQDLTTKIARIDTTASDLLIEVQNRAQAILGEIANRTNAIDTAITQEVSDREASISMWAAAEVDDRNAVVATEALARITDDSALASQITILDTTVGENTSAILTEATARTDADTAIATTITSLATSVGENSSAITAETTARTTADESLASQITTLSTSTSDNSAAIQTESTARSDADTALSTTISTLESTVGENTSAVQVTAEAVDGISAQYTVKVDSNGRVGGYGIAANPINVDDVDQGVVIDFQIVADRFSIWDPTSDQFVIGTSNNIFFVKGVITVLPGSNVEVGANATDLSTINAGTNLVAHGGGYAKGLDGRPAGVKSAYYDKAATFISFHDEAAGQIALENSTSGSGICWPAFKIEQGTKYIFRVKLRNTLSAQSTYIRLYEYSGVDLPEGKTHVSNNASTSVDSQWIVEDTSSVTSTATPDWEARSIPTTWVQEEIIYTPSASAKWCSPVILANGSEGNLVIDYVSMTAIFNSDADVTDYSDFRVSNSGDDGDVIRITNPQGGALSGDNTLTGFIKVTLPVDFNSTMMKFVVEITSYDTEKSMTLLVGGYNYDGTDVWVNTFAQIIGSITGNNHVRFGYDGTKCCVIIGDIGDTWEYPKVVVRDFMGGHSGGTLAKWGTGGWAVSILNTEAGITFSGDDITDALLDAKAIKNQGPLATVNSTGATILDAGTLHLSGSNANIAIGASTDWASNGIQLQYNEVGGAAKPRAHIGSTTNYVRYDGTNLVIATNAIGAGATIGTNSVAFGTSADASGDNSLALGVIAKADSSNSIGLGYASKARNTDAIAIGTDTIGDGSKSIAIGRSAEAFGNNATSLGTNTKSNGLNAVALGPYSECEYDNSVAIGTNVNVTAANQIRLGRSSETVSIPGDLEVGTEIYSGGAIYEAGTNLAAKYESLMANPAASNSVIWEHTGTIRADSGNSTPVTTTSMDVGTCIKSGAVRVSYSWVCNSSGGGRFSAGSYTSPYYSGGSSGSATADFNVSVGQRVVFSAYCNGNDNITVSNINLKATSYAVV